MAITLRRFDSWAILTSTHTRYGIHANIWAALSLYRPAKTLLQSLRQVVLGAEKIMSSTQNTISDP